MPGYNSLVMCVAIGVFAERKKVTKVIAREVTLDVILAIDDARRQRFLVRLALQNLLFDASRLQA